jgi:hypothetical protein
LSFASSGVYKNGSFIEANFKAGQCPKLEMVPSFNSGRIPLETQLSGLGNPFRTVIKGLLFSSGASAVQVLKISENPFTIWKCQFFSFLVKKAYVQVGQFLFFTSG